jgi:repressor LexA
MKENGELEYNGRRSVSTRRMEMEQIAHAMPVLGYVACGEGQEETEQVIEYIRMPESLVGKGEFFALIAKGESMIDAGIHPGDYVMIRKQNTAEIGDIVVALDQGVNNLKVLGFNHNKGAYFLRSCNEDKERYGDIYPEELQIQGVAVCVAHRLKKML